MGPPGRSPAGVEAGVYQIDSIDETVVIPVVLREVDAELLIERGGDLDYQRIRYSIVVAAAVLCGDVVADASAADVQLAVRRSLVVGLQAFVRGRVAAAALDARHHALRLLLCICEGCCRLVSLGGELNSHAQDVTVAGGAHAPNPAAGDIRRGDGGLARALLGCGDEFCLGVAVQRFDEGDAVGKRAVGLVLRAHLVGELAGVVCPGRTRRRCDGAESHGGDEEKCCEGAQRAGSAVRHKASFERVEAFRRTARAPPGETIVGHGRGM